MGYTLIIQNNASRKEWLITGLTDSSKTFLAYVFEGFKMPDGAPAGEYTCALFYDGREDTEYELSDDILNTLCKTDEGNAYVRDLRPEIFILKYGRIEEANVYRKENKDYIYYNG